MVNNKMNNPIEVITEVGFSAIGKKAAEAVKKVDIKMTSPAKEVADEAGRIGYLAKLKGVIEPHSKELQKIAWKDLKAVTVAVISAAPVIGQAEGGALATKTLTEAAILEGATKIEAAALAKGSVVMGGGVVGETLTKIVGKKTLEGVNKIVKAVDPFEDVPTVIVVAAGGAEMLGVVGALAVPAVIQLGKNAVDRAVEGVKMGIDVYKVTSDEVKDRINKFKSPEMVASAAAFA